MRALAIDTVTEMCSVALWVDGQIIDRQRLAPNQHSNLILGMIEEVLGEAGLELTQLDVIINDVGPGSFTGIRIGMGVTQGLAYAADIPVFGVDALSSLAYGVKHQTDHSILAAIDARMGQIYWGLFMNTGDEIFLEGQPRLSDPGKIDTITGPVCGVGSGWDVYAERLSEQIPLDTYVPDQYPMAINVLNIGLSASQEEWMPAAHLMPIYLRDKVAKISNKPRLN